MSNFAAVMEMPDKKYFLTVGAIFMAAAFVVLVAMQIVYYSQTAELLENQFSLSVRRAITQTAKAIEEEEIAQIVREIAEETTPEAERAKAIIDAGNAHSLQQIYMSTDRSSKSLADSISMLKADERVTGITASTSESVSRLSDNLAANRNLMFAVLARKYAHMSSERIGQRVTHDFIRATLAKFLNENGIDLDFSFAVVNNNTKKVYNTGEDRFDINDHRCYSARTYSHGPSHVTYDMVLFFPNKRPFLYDQLDLMIPYLVASILLLVICVSTFIYLLHQRQLAQIQNDFVRNMTHELKTPVASISLAAQMLSDPTVHLPAKTAELMCVTIRDESKRLTRLIDSVLQTSVLEQQGRIANPSPLDVNDIIQTARNGLLMKVENKGGEIRLFLDADEFIIEGDETHFTNIIFNLMENAIKYASPDRAIIIEVHTYNKNKRLYIEISDNGIGIDQQYMPYIFDKYYRVPTGNEHSVKGFGLGLAYVHNMVQRHEGHINVESQLGLGTRFIIDIPIYTE